MLILFILILAVGIGIGYVLSDKKIFNKVDENNFSIQEDKKDNIETSNTLQNLNNFEYAKEYIKIIDNIEKNIIQLMIGHMVQWEMLDIHI